LDTTEKNIKRCERMPRELWDNMDNHYGSYIAWRSFVGIVVPDANQTKLEGLAALIPETLVLRTWLKEGEEDLIILQTGINYGGIDGDKGTPLYSQEQLWDMVIGKYRYEPVASLLMDFEHWRDIYGHNELVSINQLLEAFVMHEKYNKVWDEQKEDWVKLPNEG